MLFYKKYRALSAYFVLLSLLLSFSGAAAYEAVLLKNGRVVEGNITYQSKYRIKIRLENGKTQTINKKTIRRIVYGKRKDARRKIALIKRQEAKKRKEAARKKAEARKRKIAEKKRKDELARKKREDEKKRKEELARKKREEEKRRLAEIARKKREEEKRRQDEIARKKREEEKRRQEKIAWKKREEEKKRQAELARKKRAEEKKRKEELARKKIEDEKKRAKELTRKEKEEAQRRRKELARLERIRLERTKGELKLSSGVKIKGKVLVSDGEVLTVETEYGILRLKQSDLVEMLVTVEGKKERLAPSEVAGLQVIKAKEKKDQGKISLSSGTLLKGKVIKNPDGTRSLQTDVGTFPIPPDSPDSPDYVDPAGKQSDTPPGREAEVGEEARLTLSGGQVIEGKILLKAKHVLVIETPGGVFQFQPEQIYLNRKKGSANKPVKKVAGR